MAVKGATGKTLPPSLPGARSLLGLDVYRYEPWLKDMQAAWVRQNVALVKSIGTQYHGQLETIIRNGVFNGSSVKQVSDQIQKQFGVTKNRATLIATDQILSANARVTQIRAESIGVEQYEWATVGDSRVRPDHVELNGKVFSWDKPPSVGHPGSPIRCRCRASLLLPEFDDVEVSEQIKPIQSPSKASFIDESKTELVNVKGSEITKIIDSIPSDQAAMMAALPKPAKIETKGRTGIYYPSKKHLIANTETEGGRVFLHEYGHHIDKVLSGDDVKSWSAIDGSFSNALELDRKGLSLYGKNLAPSMQSLASEMYNDVIKTKTMTNGKTIMWAAKEIKKAGANGISDIIDALTSGGFQNAHDAFGHGKKYYKIKGNREAEIFANLFELRAKKTHWAETKEKFPNLTKRFEEVVNEQAAKL
jgi:SPP1 gp7 family putative phage head morphogenesis protein